MKESLTLIAHRGYSDRFPENTLLSFEEAMRVGAGLLECDVHLSADGKVVVLHDPILERTTTGKGPIVKLPWSEIRKVSAHYPKKFGEDYRGLKIPLLEEVLDLVKGRARLFIEIKPEAVTPGNPAPIVAAVLQVLKKRKRMKEVALISFHRPALRQCRDLSAEVKIGALFHAWPLKNPVALTEEIGANFMILNKRILTKRYTSRLQNDHLPIGAYTVDDPQEAKHLFDLGVRAIATNRILEMSEALKHFDGTLDLRGDRFFT